MITQHENTSPELWTRPLRRKDGPVALVHREDEAALKQRVSLAEKGPTFLNAYVIPVLVLNLAVLSWSLVATHVAEGVMVYLGYALIITVGLRLFLAYLDNFGWRS